MRSTRAILAAFSFAAALPLFGDEVFESSTQDAYFPKHTVTTLVVYAPDYTAPRHDFDYEPGLYTRGMDAPGGIQDFYKALKPYYEHQPVSTEMLAHLKKAIVEYYQRHDRPVISVKILPQKIQNGVLKVTLTEATIDEIKFSGNKWFGDKQLKDYIDFESGDKIRRDVLSKDLELMNRNPFRRTDVVFSPGSKTSTTNLEFITKDQFPVRVYSGMDNTGFRDTRYNRWFGGLNIGNLAFADHLLDYQYMAGPSGHDFFSHTVKYSAPLPWKDYLVVYGGYSATHFKDQPVRSSGKSAQASVRYEIPIFPKSQLLQEITVGFDYKYVSNHLFGTSGTLFKGITNLSDFMLGYNLGWERSFYRSSFTAEGFWSPGALLKHESREAYNSMRAYARSQFLYGRFALAPTFWLPKDWSVQLTLRGQVSNRTLLQSEQFAVGGYSTVRGYLEREVAGDDAFIGNLELRTPPLKVLQQFSKKLHEDSLVFLVFLDYGYVHNLHSITFEKQNATLIGVGPGARYNMGPYISGRADWGFQLKKTGENPFFRNHVHFSLILAY
jgi:hemolysin activation/secretion protein